MSLHLHALLNRYGLWLAFPAGALLALAFAPFGVWPLAIICPAYLFLVWHDATPRRAAAIGFAFQGGTFLAGTYWLYHAVHTVGGESIGIALLLMLGLVAIMALYMALLGYLQARYLPQQGLLRYVLTLPAVWVLLEWLRGWLFTGFPWLSLGYAVIDSPLAGWAPVLGVYGVTWACALCAGALAACVVLPNKQRVWALLVAALPCIATTWLWHRDWTQQIDAPVSVAVVQGAVPQDQKWSETWRDKTLARYRELAEPYFGTQLIIWPEAALPDLSYELTDYLSKLWTDAHAAHSDILMGLLHYDAKQDAYYNGVLALADDVQWYHKRHLVPFAEYFPSFVRGPMRLLNLRYGDFTAGAMDQTPLQAAGQNIAATICYEDGFGAEQLLALKQATLLVNVTNDAWFGDSTAPPQHLEISRMRALESGRDMARAANDGISALISADGSVQATLPRFKADVLMGKVQPRTGLTPYARMGNMPVVYGCLLMVVFGVVRRWRVNG